MHKSHSRRPEKYHSQRYSASLGNLHRLRNEAGFETFCGGGVGVVGHGPKVLLQDEGIGRLNPFVVVLFAFDDAKAEPLIECDRVRVAHLDMSAQQNGLCTGGSCTGSHDDWLVWHGTGLQATGACRLQPPHLQLSGNSKWS